MPIYHTGSPPASIVLNSNTGQLMSSVGQPKNEEHGTYKLNMQVKDSSNNIDHQSLDLDVNIAFQTTLNQGSYSYATVNDSICVYTYYVAYHIYPTICIQNPIVKIT
jgi:hypothetical protein